MPGAEQVVRRLNDLSADVSVSSPARGDILYRGASRWNNLAAGTSGRFLQSQGAGADPVWAVVSGAPGGSDGQLQYNSSNAFAGVAGSVVAINGNLLTLQAQAVGDTPLVLKGAASQSGPLLKALTSIGGTLAQITSTGLYTGTLASSSLTGQVAIGSGGTGQATANSAFNALAPAQGSANGKFLTSNGTDASWATVTPSPGGSAGQVQYNSGGTTLAGADAVTYATSGDLLTLAAQVATDVPLVVKGAASQSVPHLRMDMSTGVLLGHMRASGANLAIESQVSLIVAAGLSGSGVMALSAPGGFSLVGDINPHQGNYISQGSANVLAFDSAGAGRGRVNWVTDELQFWPDRGSADGNISMFGSPTYGGGKGVLFIGQDNTDPTTDPVAGVVLYVDSSGNLMARTSAGNVRVVAAV